MTQLHPAFGAFLLGLTPAAYIVPRECSPLAIAGAEGFVLFVAVAQCGLVEWMFVGSCADEWDAIDRLADVVGDAFADRTWSAWCEISHAEQLARVRAPKGSLARFDAGGSAA